jgi:hypothetical protein
MRVLAGVSKRDYPPAIEAAQMKVESRRVNITPLQFSQRHDLRMAKRLAN